MFSLEKLKVYERALASVAALAQLSANWDKRHAVADQLLRASESVVLNLAEGARLRGSPQRQHRLDYSIGSALECAACLDVAQRKQLVCPPEVFREKKALCEVVKMLFGLRRSWTGDSLQEESADYTLKESFLFAHERLDAYQIKVSTYIQLCQRTGEMKAEFARRGLVLLDRVALLVRGLVEMG